MGLFARFGLFVVLSSLTIMGCAPATVDVVSESGAAMPAPDRILVYNYAVSADEITLDQRVSDKVMALMGTPQPTWTEKELEIGRSVANALASNLAAELRKIGYPASRASGVASYRGDNVLVIEGQITSVNQGSRAERVVIGLGAGHSDVKANTQVYDLQREGRNLVEEFTTDARSGYKPGMLETEGASAAMGHWALGLAAGTGLNIATEKYSDNVNADAKKTAEEIAKQLAELFQNRGWNPTY